MISAATTQTIRQAFRFFDMRAGQLLGRSSGHHFRHLRSQPSSSARHHLGHGCAYGRCGTAAGTCRRQPHHVILRRRRRTRLLDGSRSYRVAEPDRVPPCGTLASAEGIVGRWTDDVPSPSLGKPDGRGASRGQRIHRSIGAEPVSWRWIADARLRVTLATNRCGPPTGARHLRCLGWTRQNRSRPADGSRANFEHS